MNGIPPWWVGWRNRSNAGNLIFADTFLGLYVSREGGAKWQRTGSDLITAVFAETGRGRVGMDGRAPAARIQR